MKDFPNIPISLLHYSLLIVSVLTTSVSSILFFNSYVTVFTKFKSSCLLFEGVVYTTEVGRCFAWRVLEFYAAYMYRAISHPNNCQIIFL